MKPNERENLLKVGRQVGKSGSGLGCMFRECSVGPFLMLVESVCLDNVFSPWRFLSDLYANDSSEHTVNDVKWACRYLYTTRRDMPEWLLTI